MAQTTTCAHPTCTCSVSSTGSVQRNGKQYCSHACADDRGCDHPDCNCEAGTAQRRKP